MNNNISFRPCGYRVLVEIDSLETVTESGIIITSNTVDKEAKAVTTGRLVAIGATAWCTHRGEEPWACVGDKVMFARYAGSQIKDPVSNKIYHLMNDEEIQAVIKE